MTHRAGLDFGSSAVEANRDHFPYDFTTAYDNNNDETKWKLEGMKADAVFGVPPCSGFSSLSSKGFRGMDSPANECMWSLIRGAAMVSPDIVVFESVTAAFTQGRPLMQALRTELETLTGEQYGLYHIKHNALNVGGSAIRNRYFFVVSRVPFGVELEDVPRVPTIVDTVGDLAKLKLQWEEQSYNREPSWFAEGFRNPAGVVDGHMTRDSMHARRMQDVMSIVEWPPGKDEAHVIHEMWKANDFTLPESFEGIRPRIEKRLLIAEETDSPLELGFNGTYRWRPTHPAYVTTGDAANKLVHPTENRFFTARELARIIGFPDTWRIEPYKNDSHMFAFWGKCVSVPCGKWIGEWTKRSIEGNPGSYSGELIGDREWLIDDSRGHKQALGDLLEYTTGRRDGRTVKT
jgi:site-specific DNA-cytosine methylase